MSDLLQNLLNSISTTSGFILFVAAMTLAYTGVWFLFLFDDSPKPVAKAGSKGGNKGQEGEASEEKKQPAPAG